MADIFISVGGVLRKSNTMKIQQLNLMYNETLFVPILDFVQTRLLESRCKNEISYEVVPGDLFQALQLKIQSFNFWFCFWADEKRFSFLIDDKEIMDEFLENEADSTGCVEFLTTIFSNPIHVRSFSKNKQVYRVIYRYFIKSENGLTEFEDTASLRMKFFGKKSILDKELASCLG